MAPPRKRRRLSPFNEPILPPPNKMVNSESSAAHEHLVSDLTYNFEVAGAQSVPKPVENSHLQIQANAHNALRPRQVIGVITSAIDSAVRLGPSSTLASITPSTSQTGGITIASSSTSRTTLASSSSFPSISIGSASSNGTIHTTHSTTLPITYTATLTNHNVKTITRSPTAYVTTFGDGQISTICNRYGGCKMSTSSFKSTETTSSLFPTTTATPTTPAVVITATASPTTAAPASSSTSAAAHHQQTTSAAPPPATIAGGAVGGIAGVAFLVVLVAIFIRLYKRKAHTSHRALLNAGDNFQSHNRSGMIELSSGMSSLVNVLPPLFRHQNKSQDPSSPPTATPNTEERGFTKVSGRKLPSVWSEGMTQEQIARSVRPTMPLAQNYSTPNLINRDSAGSYTENQNPCDRGTRSISPDLSPFADPGTSPVSMTLSPGPQRTPKFVHESSPYFTPSSRRASIPIQQAMVQKRYRSARARGPSPPRSLQPGDGGMSESPQQEDG